MEHPGIARACSTSSSNATGIAGFIRTRSQNRFSSSCSLGVSSLGLRTARVLNGSSEMLASLCVEQEERNFSATQDNYYHLHWKQEEKGMIQLLLDYLMPTDEKCKENSYKVSYMEIYNDSIYDLLAPQIPNGLQQHSST